MGRVILVCTALGPARARNILNVWRWRNPLICQVSVYALVTSRKPFTHLSVLQNERQPGSRCVCPHFGPSAELPSLVALILTYRLLQRQLSIYEVFQSLLQAPVGGSCLRSGHHSIFPLPKFSPLSDIRRALRLQVYHNLPTPSQASRLTRGSRHAKLNLTDYLAVIPL